jgi:DNA-binding NtrC family response regulator
VKDKVLVIDDEDSIRFGLTKLLTQAGYECVTASSASEGFQFFTSHNPSVVLLDFKLPDTEGLEFMHKLKDTDPYVSIIMMTAYGTIETAVTALKSGAENFLTKPIDPDGLLVLLKKTLEINEIKRRSDYSKLQQESTSADYYLGQSDKLQKVHEMVRLLAGNDTTVLILGETGSGKGLYARLIHNLSSRSSYNFVELNCAGFTRELMESELFGYDKGAFTGAVGNKPGLFELANGGTLFLDEIGEMDINVQAKLLKVIEDKKFRRLGGIQEKVVDCRLIAASNRNLAKEVKNKAFREDLFYRLNVMPVTIPPLRELKEDILPLAEYFLHSVSLKQGKKIAGFTVAAQQVMMNYSWPGNIRELSNLVERSVILCRGNQIDVADLGLAVPSRAASRGMDDSNLTSLEDMEKEHIRRVLAGSGKNLSRAAEILGITRSTLYSKIRRYNLEVPGDSKV